MKIWLLDTGPIVAYLDPHDPAHEACAEAMDDFSGQWITTGAVIVEAMHFLVRHVDGPAILLQFLESSGTEVVECCQPGQLLEAVGLMTQYADTPMDFADATLVQLADALGQHHICTLDRRGFRTFRTASGKRFHLVVDDY